MDTIADSITQPLLKLVHSTHPIDTQRIWRSIDVDNRQCALELLFRDPEEAATRESLIGAASRALRFREQTFRKYSDTKLAARIARLDVVSDSSATSLLKVLHISGRREMLRDFLDGTGIPNDDGVTSSDVFGEGVEPEVLARAADDLAARYPQEHVAIYFLTMIALGCGFASELTEWLRRRYPICGQASSDNGTHIQSTSLAEPDSLSCDEAGDDFTTLDRQLIRIIVDSAQGVEGSLRDDQLDDLIQEIIELNSTRHRSYYHAGLKDAIFSHSPLSELPAANQTRRQWYWAGYVQGLAREDRWAEIVECFDAVSVVRELGKTGRGPSDLAVRSVFKALCVSGRPAEAANFLTPEAIFNCRALLDDIHQCADPILREDRAPDARALFDVLGMAIDLIQQNEEDTSTRDFLEYRRRRAHCYRQLGESTYAAKLLEALLSEEPDRVVRSDVLTDLGLIDAGFRRLSDLRVPDNRAELNVFAEALERGLARFLAAVEELPEASVHARYCLGVLSIVHQDFAVAADHFDVALSGFESSPAKYSAGGLIPMTRMYLGVSLALDLQTHRAARAASLLVQALKGGARVPTYFLSNVVDALALGDLNGARELAEALLQASGASQLDALIASEVASDSKIITDALLIRATDRHRPESWRVADRYSALPGLLQQKRFEEAALVLDALEDAATKGFEADRFLDLMKEPGEFAPAWSEEDAADAQLHCLEALGRYREAFILLSADFHRVLARLDADGIPYAEALLEHICSYGLEEGNYAHLARRLEAIKTTALDCRGKQEIPSFGTRILFVGGDSAQHKRDHLVLETLRDVAPHVALEFRHPGWSSNWSASLDEIVKELPQYDGVVLSRFMRTNFGRMLRKEINQPWRGCWGTGIKGVVASVVAVDDAIHAAATQRVYGLGG